jgi:hypothetical protein
MPRGWNRFGVRVGSPREGDALILPPVKKIISSGYEGSLPPVVLYEPDLQLVIDVLLTHADTTVSIECGDTVYDSLAELRDHESHLIRTLKITATVTKVGAFDRCSVHFYDNRVYLVAGAGFELQARRIAEILTQKRAILGRIPQDLWFAMIAVVWLAFAVVPTLLHYGVGLDGTPYMILTLVCLAGVIALASGRVRLRRNALVLRRSHEHQNILQRYAPDIVKAVISGLIGGLIGYWLKK